MKSIVCVVVLLIAFAFTNCGSGKVVYAMAEEQFVYERDSLPYGDQKILTESLASFSTYEFKEGREPLGIYVRFNGLMPRINTIEKVSLELQYKNEKGEMITVQPKAFEDLKVEYSKERAVVSLPIKNEHIWSQVKWREADWGEYTKNNSIDFMGTFLFELEDHPPTMLMKFKIAWKEAEKQFETTLTRGDYVGPKFNPKF
jgi:hypothetical protein